MGHMFIEVNGRMVDTEEYLVEKAKTKEVIPETPKTTKAKKDA